LLCPSDLMVETVQQSWSAMHNFILEIQPENAETQPQQLPAIAS